MSFVGKSSCLKIIKGKGSGNIVNKCNHLGVRRYLCQHQPNDVQSIVYKPTLRLLQLREFTRLQPVGRAFFCLNIFAYNKC